MKVQKLLSLFFISIILIFTTLLAISYFNNKTLFNFNNVGKSVEISLNSNYFLKKINTLLFSMNISSNTNDVIIGSDKMLFLSNNFINTKPSFGMFSTVEINEWITKFDELLESYKKLGFNNVFLFLAPNKSSVYYSSLPSVIKTDKSNDFDVFFMSDLLQSHPNIYSPFDLFKQLKLKNSLYYKFDTHWNEWAAINSYIQAFDKFGYPYVSNINYLYGFKERVNGDLIKFLNVDDVINEELYRFPQLEIPIKFKNHNSLTYTDIYIKNIKINSKYIDLLNYKGHYKIKVLWVTDSFGSNASLPMIDNFMNIRKMHYSAYSSMEYKRILAEYNPDLIIFNVVERELLTFMQLDMHNL